MIRDLVGKVAIVTGGSKGMGLAMAHRFASGGAKVAICSNEPGSIAEALETAPESSEIKGFVADVAKIADMEMLVSETVTQFGGVDILANCAGIQRYGNVVDTTEAVWDEVFAVNLKGIFLASKFAVPEIEKRGGGSIINIASVQAYASQSNVAAYTATKGAILALTRAMALDHADAGVRVNAICPASVDTPMLRWAADLWKGERSAEEMVELWGKAHPAGRVGRPEEIAELAAFLAGDSCPFMTGADLKVDGGVLAKLGILLPD
jgi:NAD(P)-dependent dehydrogenase (short-subunit alcohol dehydrogenase family)